MKKNLRGKKKQRNFLNKDFLLSLTILIVCIVGVFTFTVLQYTRMWEISPTESVKVIANSSYWHARGFAESLIPSPPPSATKLRLAPTITPSYPSSTPQPTPKAVEYTSDNLGVSFLYISKEGSQNLYVKEIDDHIFLYFPNENVPFTGTDDGFLKKFATTNSKYMEVFKKDPNQSLTDAIKQHILSGYKEDDCVLKEYTYGPSKRDPSFQSIVVSYDRTKVASHSDWYKKKDICPVKYTQFGGHYYFTMDKNHPGTFIFVAMGQDSIGSGIENIPWDQTIKVFK